MGEEIVAVALEIVADECGVVAVGDEAHALGEERILDLDLLEADRALLAGDLGEEAISSTSSRAVQRRMVKANFMPSGRPCNIAESGKRIRVAAAAPPKMTMKAWMSRNIRKSPPIRMRVTMTMATPASSRKAVAISMRTGSEHTLHAERTCAAAGTLLAGLHRNPSLAAIKVT